MHSSFSNRSCNKARFSICTKFGVANVAELRQALGTSADEPPKKVPKAVVGSDCKEKEDTSNDGVVYKDSSTFLKVFYLEIVNFF